MRLFQAAVFVDAGYLFAQASVALTGEKQPRTSVQLNPAATISALKTAAREAADGARLLRIYWYDGVSPARGMSAEQTNLGQMSDVKLRLGFINNFGQQKGVDSLIVTDLIELARNRAISDAVILSGDEDIRVGVQVAQTFGVRVHLIGIKPARGSQAMTLLQECDTTREWDAGVVGGMVSLGSPKSARIVPAATMNLIADSAKHPAAQLGQCTPEVQAAFEVEVAESLDSLDAAQRLQFRSAIEAARGALPPELDRPLLARTRNRLGRDLEDFERRALRRLLSDKLAT